ncbi:SHOCT domain-containing protein [Patescibacteria group bacterium]|nr:SHOCT domain-containing protein [Patescibacteria group bacterium]
MYRYGYHMMGTSAFPLGGLISIIFWALLISLVVGLLVHLFDSRNAEEAADENSLENNETALAILKKRYVKGEITKREFVEMKKDIA